MTYEFSLIDKITDLVDQLLELIAFLIPIFLFIITVLGIFRLVDIYICEQDSCFLSSIRNDNSIVAF